MLKKTILVVIGTRPEAVKMCPLVNELKKREELDVAFCVSGQHSEMLYDVLDYFGVIPDYDLKLMKPGQTLFDISSGILSELHKVIGLVRPKLTLVHGDTATAAFAALACFFMQIPVGHIEAGLRSYNMNSPFPEEFNRRMISLISSYDFAPTVKAAENLISEGKLPERVYITGNTVIDALRFTVKEAYRNDLLDAKGGDKRIIIFTSHRRENSHDTLCGILEAMNRIASEFDDVLILCPVHKNPALQKLINESFSGKSNIRVSEPMGVYDFHNILARSYLIVTDSGGIQEEAASLGIPTLVIRNETERQEAQAAGVIKLIGTSEQAVYNNVRELLDNKELYNSMAHPCTDYGNGDACKKIAGIICGIT